MSIEQSKPLVEFWHGISRITPLSCASMAVTFSASMVVLVPLLLSITPQDMAGDLPRYIAYTPVYDDRCYMSGDAIALHSGLCRSPDVIVFGGSSTAQATGDCEVIRREVGRSIGREVEVLTHCTGGLSYDEIELLTMHLPRDFSGAVVLGIGPQSVSRLPSNPKELITGSRWALAPEVVSSYAKSRELSIALGENYFQNNQNFFLPRFRALFFNMAVCKLPPYDRVYLFDILDKGPPEAAWEWHARRTSKRMKRYAKNHARQFATLRRVIDSLPNQAKVLLVETPLNPVLIEKWIGESFYEDHLRKVREFAANEGVAFINLNAVGEFETTDFSDSYHLCRLPVIERSQTLIANEVTKLMETR